MNIYHETILEVIQFKPAIRSVDLAMSVMNRINPVKFNSGSYDIALEELIEKNQIIELEYITEERLKSIYFPKETKIVLSKLVEEKV